MWVHSIFEIIVLPAGVVYRKLVELAALKVLKYTIRHVFKLEALRVDILQIAFPAALALAADPIASLIDTAFIGHLGPVPLAAVGVSISIFNQVSKVTIFPLSLTTSFVAEEDTVGRINREAVEDENLEKISAKKNEMKELKLEDVVLENLEKRLDTNGEMKELMPVCQKKGSPMLNPAQRYLTLKALGAPTVLLSLAMQGVFWGNQGHQNSLICHW
ncbi:hypothetical protein ACSBR2_041712 [Camellia fascicularis]